MPDVPRVPGVPALSSYAVLPFLLLAGDVLRSILGPLVTRWGIFLNGLPVLPTASTITFDYTQDYTISNYPTERGGFQSYNKVAQPAKIKMRMAKGGTEAERAFFLSSVMANMDNTEVYDVLTPEALFPGYNFTHMSTTRKSDNGLGLLVIDIWLEQIRLTASGQLTTTPTATEANASNFTNTQQPGQAGQQGLGNIQPLQGAAVPFITPALFR